MAHDRLHISGKGSDLSGLRVTLNGTRVHPTDLKLSFRSGERTVAKLTIDVDEVSVTAEALVALEAVAGLRQGKLVPLPDVAQ